MKINKKLVEEIITMYKSGCDAEDIFAIIMWIEEMYVGEVV